MRENKLKRLVDDIGGLTASELATIKDVVERRERVVDSEIFDSEMSGYVKECPHCRSKVFTAIKGVSAISVSLVASLSMRLQAHL